MSGTRINTDIDFERRGKQVSFLRLPFSDNEHAFGFVPVPIAVIANGDGPSVLLVAGTHGDEYEGQAILRRMIQELDAEQVRGRLIVLPAHNFLAVQAGARCWPGDNHNMNRVFPGDPDGTPTLATAHFVQSVLLPMCDFGIDLHSGGRDSEYLPCVYLRHSGDARLMQAKIDATEAFGAPLVTVVARTSDDRSLLAAGDRAAVPMIATELRGMGAISIDALEIGRRGVLRTLHHLGVLGAPAIDPPPAAPRYVRYVDHSAFTHVADDGLFEPFVALGADVREGQCAGLVHSLKDAARPATAVRFSRSGSVIARRAAAPVKCGDYVFAVANDVDPGTLIS